MADVRPMPGTRRAIRPDDALHRRKAANKLRRKRRMISAVQRLRRRLGLTQVLVIDGVRYIERNTMPLHRALSDRGPGVKDYTVRFAPGAGSMRIRCTRQRLYADLVTDWRESAYAPAIARVRPGMRIVEVGCGTGVGSSRLARAAGPSGGVVALETDSESIRFARRRYGVAQLAFEIGGTETLAGELDGSFDGALLNWTEKTTLDQAREVWRCVRAGGWMLICNGESGENPVPAGEFADLEALGNPAPGLFMYDRAE